MRTTIKAKTGYRVRKVLIQDPNSDLAILYKKPCVLRDGEELVMIADLRTISDYKSEVEQGENEAARFCECFVTVKGNRFIYWRDEESDEDFLTKIED